MYCLLSAASDRKWNFMKESATFFLFAVILSAVDTHTHTLSLSLSLSNCIHSYVLCLLLIALGYPATQASFELVTSCHNVLVPSLD
ncbi:hypothetical protein V8C37DRAFT_384635 [Trichoderma ceciliae]